VLSGGVIHHTPDPKRSFVELSRILKKTGYLWIAVYNKNHPYRFLYCYVGKPLQILKDTFLEPILLRFIFPLFYWIAFSIAQLLIKRDLNFPSFSHAVNLFYDTFMTPVASFHTEAELCEWAKSCSLAFRLSKKEVAGQLIAMVFQKV